MHSIIMKTAASSFYITIMVLIGMSTESRAQVEYLRLSPKQEIKQRVGATDVSIIYSRPQMKGRQVFDGLVPHGQLWRTGANENTTISFSHRVLIDTTEVAAGTYTLWSKPTSDKWEIFLYSDTNLLDVPEAIDSTKLIYVTTVPSYKNPRLEETLTINIYDISETSASLGISWEHTYVRIPITFYTKEAMEKMIEREFRQNIFDYSIASSYYTQRDIELEKAKELRELAMSLKEKTNAWDHNSYGIILMKLGQKAASKEQFNTSLKLALASNNNYLIQENKRLLDLLNSDNK